MNSGLKIFPPKYNFETVKIYKALNKASRALAELKGEVKTIPNEEILINILGLQEAKDSSAIENIITTQEDLYLSRISDKFDSLAAKEVLSYSEALKTGFSLVRKNSLFTTNNILEIQSILEPNKPGFRKLPGTVLKDSLGQVVYTPPQNPDEILELMKALDHYINDDELHNIDPLVKMAIIHYQFESIHPFYDGNGRTGRIINILYLVAKELLDIPILYLSRYIVRNKSDYYKLLQSVSDNNDWENWIVWMLQGIEETATDTLHLVKEIQALMNKNIVNIKEKLPNVYSKDLIENLYKHPYTKIEYLQNDLGITRKTASKYLDLLVENGFLKKEVLWKTNYYINQKLYELFNHHG
jgi:Fic family protein